MEDASHIPAGEINIELWTILESCDDADAKLLIDFYIKQRSLKELAEEQGITVGACKMRLKRAKKRAREK